MSDQGVTGGDVWIVPSDGRPAARSHPRPPHLAAWIAWDGNEHIYVSELAAAATVLCVSAFRATAPAMASPPALTAPIFSFPGTVGDGAFDPSLSATADRSLFVFQASTFNHPARDLRRARRSNARTVSVPIRPTALRASSSSPTSTTASSPPGASPSRSPGTTTTSTSRAGSCLPANYDPAKKYPLIVEVHGGPAAAVLSRWNGGAGGFSATAFSALGYFVLMPNPRGSYGQGEAFTQANRKDFGYGDLRDILAGVDTVLAKYPVDPNRVGIAGWSYGGFMTMFAVTQTHRFRAAVAGAGISDWLSYYGENSIDQWMIPYFGASVYDDPAVYAKSSAINFIKQVTTPTLVVVGDRDGECPAPQSFEFWHALRDLHVPTAARRLSQRRPRLFRSGAPPRRLATRRRLVRPLHAAQPRDRYAGSLLPCSPSGVRRESIQQSSSCRASLSMPEVGPS